MKKFIIILNSVVFLASILCLIYIKNLYKDIPTPEQIKNVNSKYIEFIDTTNSIENLRSEYNEVINVYETTAEHNHSAYEFILALINFLMVIAFANIVIILISIYENRRKITKSQR